MNRVQNAITRRPLVALGLALLILTLAAPALPDVKYTTVTRTRLAGPLGKAVNLFAKLGGGSDTSEQTEYVKGNKMRTDAGDASSTIIDLDGERFINIDHKKKTYMVVTFEALRQQVEQTIEDVMEAPAEEAPEERAPAEAQESNTEVEFDLNIDATGETAMINGHSARRTLMTITVEATNTAPQGSEEQGLEGTLVLASEMWLADEIEGYEEVEAFFQRMAQTMGETMTSGRSNPAEQMQAAVAQDPRIGEALEQWGKEAEKLEGVELKNTTHIVLVPPGMEYKPELAFAEAEVEEEVKEEKKKRGLGGFAKRMAREALTARAGSGDSEEQEGEGEAATPGQTTIMTITTELQQIETATLPASLFDVPSGYREVKMEQNR